MAKSRKQGDISMALPSNNERYWVAWYKTAAWARLRKWQLQREPCCCFCDRDGRVTPANTVDHKIPHKGDKKLFFDRDNLQSLCKPCHSSEKQREEKATVKGCDAKGIVPAWQ